MVIGHESSPFHSKISFLLKPGPTPIAETAAVER